MAHHLIIQKEVDKLLAMGAIEPLAGDSGFYSNVFVLPKYTRDLQPILSLKWFNFYMLIPTFNVPSTRQVLQLIQQGDYAFSIVLKDAHLNISIVQHHHKFLHFVWQNNQCRVMQFGLGMAP